MRALADELTAWLNPTPPAPQEFDLRAVSSQLAVVMETAQQQDDRFARNGDLAAAALDRLEVRVSRLATALQTERIGDAVTSRYVVPGGRPRPTIPGDLLYNVRHEERISYDETYLELFGRPADPYWKQPPVLAVLLVTQDATRLAPRAIEAL